MKSYNYIAYGVGIKTNRKLPVQLPAFGEYDHQISLIFSSAVSTANRLFSFCAPVMMMHGREIMLASNLPLHADRKSMDRQWKLEISGLFSFRWNNRSLQLQVSGGPDPDLEKLSFWLLHTVIPAYLMLKGSSFFLHASSVEVENHALLFLAPSFGGKSSLADRFVRHGYNIISDDKIRLRHQNGKFVACPSHPYRRPFRQNEILGKFSPRFAIGSKPLKAMYALRHVETECDIQINEIEGLNKFETIRDSYLYKPVSLTKRELENLLLLAQKIRVFIVHIPYGLEWLSSSITAIKEHAENLENRE